MPTNGFLDYFKKIWLSLLGIGKCIPIWRLGNVGNWKMYSIKRLFYLCNSIKIKFFKTFMLPFFNYCLSLIIYFLSTPFQSLCKSFNLGLLQLFNFKPEDNSEEEDQVKLISDFLVKLRRGSLKNY